MPWTKERLEEVARTRLGGARLVVVANREPYIHACQGGDVRCLRPASGLATALDPVLRACGGTWVAHGSGDADRAAADEHGRVAVPPEAPAYTLRRVWLGKGEVEDYHFALLPRMLKEARADLVVLQFWHIPWPNREVFRICPWQEEVLDGLLGNDLLSFHIQYHCNNFLETVDRALESRVDLERFAVTRGGKTTCVRPQPISIDPDLVAASATADAKKEEWRIRKRLGLRDQLVLLGVDRV